MKLRCLIIFLFWSTLIHHLNAQDCLPTSSEHLEGTIYTNDPIPDDHVGVVAELHIPGIQSPQTASTEFLNVETNIETGVVTISVNDNFRNYEEITESGTLNPLIVVSLQLGCISSQTSTLLFRQPIIDINSPPTMEPEYRYSLPMPFPSGIDITLMGKEIIARDIDVTNNDMTFTINSPDFIIASVGAVDSANKNFRATLKAAGPLELTDGSAEYVITATDSQGLATTARLIIDIDVENSVPAAPRFDQPYYEVQYTVTDTALHSASVTIDIENAEGAEFQIGGPYQDHFRHSYSNGQLTIELTQNLDNEDIDESGFRVIVVTASVSTTRFDRTVILLQLPERIVPRFIQRSYDVPYTVTDTGLHSASVTMDIENAEDASFEIEGPYRDHFDHSYSNGQLTIDLIRNLDDEDIDESGYRPIVVTASVSSTRFDSAVILLKLPERIVPRFLQPYYDVEYSVTDTGLHSASVTMDIENAEDASFEIVGPYQNNFGHSYSNGQLTIELTQNLDNTDIDESGYRVIVVRASVSSTRLDSAVILLKLPEQIVPRFLQLYHEVEYIVTDTGLHSASVAIDIENGEDASFAIEGPYQDHFGHIYSNGQLTIELTQNLDDEDIDESGYRLIVVTASVSTRLDRTIILLQLPERITTTTACPTDCPDCPDCPVITTPGPIDASISFTSPEFQFTISAYEDLSTHSLPLSAESTIDEDIRYSSNDLPSQLNLNEVHGLLTNRELLPVGVHSFTVTATGQESKASADVVVTITVVALEICPDGPRMSYAHVVKYVVEEEGAILLTSAFTDPDIPYRLEITEVSPATGLSLFYVSEDGQSISCYALDRESSNFDGIEVAHYTVTVRVITTTESNKIEDFPSSIFHLSNRSITSKHSSARADIPQCVLANDIMNDATQTILTVVLEDINDHQPQFPIVNDIVGYPATSLLNVVTPSYLTQVKATDADTGINSELAYFVDSPLVTIHPSTGVIYPTDAISDEGFSFTVTARDQNGNGLTSSNSLNIDVRILEEEYISVLTLRNTLLEDITAKLEELNAVASVTIRQLQAAVLPTENIKQSRADESYFLIITVYALDSINQLVTSEALQGLLANVDGLTVLTLAEYMSDNGSCTTTPPITTECPTTTPSAVDAVIEFDRDEFEFTLSASETMSTHYLPLSARSTIDEEIRYESNDLPGQLNLDSTNGMLTNDALLPAGIYQFTVTAIGQTSGASQSAIVTITVTPFEICSDGPRMSYTLLVKPVVEGSGAVLLTSALENDIPYSLEITDVSPTAGRSLFQVSSDGQSITCSALDRESSHFNDMEVTQYTVTVRVINDEETDSMEEFRRRIFHLPNEHGKRASTKADIPQCILVNDIRNDVTQTILTVVVEDVNDNAPVFATTNMVAGYPARELLALVAPSYLIQVEATDADAGINAELAYFVDTTLVTIHPRTGVIYPTEAISNEGFTFAVTARDQNGNGISSNTLNIEVRILEEKHISVLTLTNALLEDIPEKLAELNEMADVKIRQLDASVLPTENVRNLRADESYFLIITAYALDGDDNLITTEELQDTLDNVQGLLVVPISEYAPTYGPSANDAGWIAAVSVLSVLLFLILLGIVLFYYFKLRKTNTYNDLKEDEGGQSTPPAYQKNTRSVRSSSKLSQLGQDTEKAERRPTGILLTSPPIEVDDDSPTSSPPKERRKSVVFNNNVEQINIVTTTDEENSKV